MFLSFLSGLLPFPLLFSQRFLADISLKIPLALQKTEKFSASLVLPAIANFTEQHISVCCESLIMLSRNFFAFLILALSCFRWLRYAESKLPQDEGMSLGFSLPFYLCIDFFGFSEEAQQKGKFLKRCSFGTFCHYGTRSLDYSEISLIYGRKVKNLQDFISFLPFYPQSY